MDLRNSNNTIQQKQFSEKSRQTRSDKKIRVNCSLDQDTHEKLERMAIACGNMPKTRMAQEIIKFCLNNPNIINYLQEKKFPYTSNNFKVVPIIKNGKCFYN